jgi:hypothetical protein
MAVVRRSILGRIEAGKTLAHFGSVLRGMHGIGKGNSIVLRGKSIASGGKCTLLQGKSRAIARKSIFLP